MWHSNGSTRAQAPGAAAMEEEAKDLERVLAAAEMVEAMVEGATATAGVARGGIRR